jgi:HAD superfamily hydrolase (TIGR01509 family)
LLRALIFDVDGTLAETERDGHRCAFNRAFCELGLDWHWDEGRYGELLAIAGGKERLRYDALSRGVKPGGELDALIERLHRCKTTYYLALLNQGQIGLRPGVARLLREARRHGLRLAIATTTTQDNVTTLLGRLLGTTTLDWFDVMGAGDVVAAKKPAPDIYRWVLQRLELAADQCIAVEDSAIGLQAALDAGLTTLITRSQYTQQQDFAGAFAVLDDLGEPERPAVGRVGSQPWCGLVDVAQLQVWSTAARTDQD